MIYYKYSNKNKFCKLLICVIKLVFSKKLLVKVSCLKKYVLSTSDFNLLAYF